MRCRGSARQAVFLGRVSSKPYRFQCHAGLTILTVPIIVAGLHLGALAAGEIIENSKLEEVILYSLSDIDIDKKKLLELYKKMPIINSEQVSGFAETLYDISNIFIKMGVFLANTNQLKCSDDLQYINDLDIPSINENELINTAEEYIIKNYNKHITLKDVANFIHLNPSYFSYLFSKIKGYTFKQFLIHLRIEESKKLLLNSTLTINQISQLIGYENSNYFSSLFKKITGFCPSSYKELTKKSEGLSKINAEII